MTRPARAGLRPAPRTPPTPSLLHRRTDREPPPSPPINRAARADEFEFHAFAEPLNRAPVRPGSARRLTAPAPAPETRIRSHRPADSTSPAGGEGRITGVNGTSRGGPRGSRQARFAEHHEPSDPAREAARSSVGIPPRRGGFGGGDSPAARRVLRSAGRRRGVGSRRSTATGGSVGQRAGRRAAPPRTSAGRCRTALWQPSPDPGDVGAAPLRPTDAVLSQIIHGHRHPSIQLLVVGSATRNDRAQPRLLP